MATTNNPQHTNSGGEPPEFVGAPEFEEAPKRGGRTSKPKTPITARGKVSLKEPIGGMLVMFNIPVQMFDPTDALDPAEIEALARALDEQAKISPRFRRYVEAMIGVGSGGQLIVVCGMIAGRRMARHGMLPNAENADLALGAQLSDVTGEKAITPEYPKPAEQPEAGEQASGIPAVGGTQAFTPS